MFRLLSHVQACENNSNEMQQIEIYSSQMPPKM